MCKKPTYILIQVGLTVVSLKLTSSTKRQRCQQNIKCAKIIFKAINFCISGDIYPRRFSVFFLKSIINVTNVTLNVTTTTGKLQTNSVIVRSPNHSEALPYCRLIVRVKGKGEG